jgi:hypothetical protein
VIRVLTAHQVVITTRDGGEDGELVLQKDEYFESTRIPLVVHKKLLRYFSRKFGVPITHFYNPTLIIPERIN